MHRAPRTALAAALGALCVLGGLSPAPAQAAPVLTLLSGMLTVSVVPATAGLTTAGSTATGSIGTTTVVDGRLGAAGYDVSVSTAGFDLVGATSATAASHIPDSAVAVRNTAVTNGTSNRTTAVALPSAVPLFHVTYTGAVSSVVNLTSTYTLAMTLTVPAAASSGLYTGTVTQTVV